jgi:DnaJ-class molecular chaperone
MAKTTKNPCPDCGGTGKKTVRYTEPETTCETCGGTGEAPADASSLAATEGSVAGPVSDG